MERILNDATKNFVPDELEPLACEGWEEVITQNYLCLNCPSATLGDLRSPGTIRLMKEDKHDESHSIPNMRTY